MYIPKEEERVEVDRSGSVCHGVVRKVFRPGDQITKQDLREYFNVYNYTDERHNSAQNFLGVQVCIALDCNPGCIHHIVYRDGDDMWSNLRAEDESYVDPMIWRKDRNKTDEVIQSGYYTAGMVCDDYDLYYAGSVHDFHVHITSDMTVDTMTAQLKGNGLIIEANTISICDPAGLEFIEI